MTRKEGGILNDTKEMLPICFRVSKELKDWQRRYCFDQEISEKKFFEMLVQSILEEKIKIEKIKEVLKQEKKEIKNKNCFFCLKKENAIQLKKISHNHYLKRSQIIRGALLVKKDEVKEI